jgi:serine protease Do
LNTVYCGVRSRLKNASLRFPNVRSFARCIAVSLACLVFPLTRADLVGPELKPIVVPPVFDREVPSTLTDLRAFQAHVAKLVAHISPAVVAVQVRGSTGTGVVVSSDGLVLTAAHVCSEPNVDVVFTFPDGRTARGKTLGVNHDTDAGMMKISEPGEWPHAVAADREGSTPGQWVLGLGHPGGFDPERSVVARLGRVIRFSSDFLQTDCTLNAGDSGGPLFDMAGQVVAIHSRIRESTTDNFHVPISSFRDEWDGLVKAEEYGRSVPRLRPYIGAQGTYDAYGCRIQSIDEDSPAAKAGLQSKDVVMRVNGQKVFGFRTMGEKISHLKSGETATLDIRRGQEELTLEVTVEMRRGR